MIRHVRDFTNEQTIYKKRLRTITLRLRRTPASNEGRSLLTVGGAGEVEDVLRSIFEQYDEDQEHFVLLVFDGSHELLGFKRLASGTQTSVMVDRALVFRNALLLGARSIMVAHNHPNGSLVPSPDDVTLTKALVELGHSIMIEVLDHIIISPKGTCASMKEREPLLWPPLKSDASAT
ncbi:MAG TPA: JAB domain-containing protein [Polyangia bacterium]|nr:JAB domain-containing protein [Polyangia bacterium]